MTDETRKYERPLPYGPLYICEGCNGESNCHSPESLTWYDVTDEPGWYCEGCGDEIRYDTGAEPIIALNQELEEQQT